MTGSISADSLVAGDVLLYRANSPISWMIRKLDGTPVSHAALYMGRDRVAEALMKPGLIERSIGESVAGCDWVDVRRLCEDQTPMDPVLGIANEYLAQGNRYAYEQILLLAGICLTRKFDTDNPLLRRIVHRAMRHAADILDRLHAENKEPMICSEFVFLCYDRAKPGMDDPYSIEIRSRLDGGSRRRFSTFRRRWALRTGKTTPTTAGPHPMSLLGMLEGRGQRTRGVEAVDLPAEASIDASVKILNELIDEYRRMGDEGWPAKGEAVCDTPGISTDELLDEASRLANRLRDAVLRRGDVDSRRFGDKRELAIEEAAGSVLSDFVTPGDLFTSRSLVSVGRIHPT